MSVIPLPENPEVTKSYDVWEYIQLTQLRNVVNGSPDTVERLVDLRKYADMFAGFLIGHGGYNVVSERFSSIEKLYSVLDSIPALGKDVFLYSAFIKYSMVSYRVDPNNNFERTSCEPYIDKAVVFRYAFVD